MDRRGRSAPALRRLHVSREELEQAPQITPLLKMANGGLKQVFSAMRLSQEEVIRTFLRRYDAIPAGDRSHLSVEAVALAAGVDMSTLMGAIMFALERQAVSTVKMIAMTAHPKITLARVKYAQRASGERDRTAMDTAMGFLPSPKGPTFIGKAVFGSGKSVMEAQGAGGGDEDDDDLTANERDPDLDTLFPPANKMQEELVLIRQRLLPDKS
jgi:hypothetical protein